MRITDDYSPKVQEAYDDAYATHAARQEAVERGVDALLDIIMPLNMPTLSVGSKVPDGLTQRQWLKQLFIEDVSECFDIEDPEAAAEAAAEQEEWDISCGPF